ncbi:MupG family TIM beta-alpha barrel fold protein [uncultured Traorella sp.]|uniref:MupG family TIM beta-alpha barrel fold protein n=1 Tax=uncultured Traorella sp. TaxID=1929048 RepID=UPI0025ED7685|nr:MupG family TIM beta-alpha barrel fold protein [uncultured Traorella sp.]
MLKSAAIYPEIIDNTYIYKVADYVKRIKRYGFNEVFTTIHLPEYSLKEQIEALKIIACETKGANLELTVDIGGHFIKDILNNDEIINVLSNLKIDYIRLDYGFNDDDAKNLYNSIKFKGYVVNASIYDPKEAKQVIEMLKNIDSKIQIRACHNYYILENTGIDPIHSIKQDTIFKKMNIPVYYCVPSYSSPRQPLKKGLCTIENHRFKSLDYILSDLLLNYEINAFMLADEWLSDEELEIVDMTLKKINVKLHDIEDIEIEFYEGTSNVEKEIVLSDHVFRYDSPFDLLRSVTSRQMAEMARSIDPNNIYDMHLGDIIIVNRLNKRYSGELQVNLRNRKKEDGSNVVARVKKQEDLVKLWRYKEKITYCFKECQG